MVKLVPRGNSAMAGGHNLLEVALSSCSWLACRGHLLRPSVLRWRNQSAKLSRWRGLSAEGQLRELWFQGARGRNESSTESNMVLRKRGWRREGKTGAETWTQASSAPTSSAGANKRHVHSYSRFFRVRYVWNFIFIEAPWRILLNRGFSELISCGWEKYAA